MSESKTSFNLGVATIVMGFVLVALGLLWPLLGVEKLMWTEQQAEQRSRAHNVAHNATMGPDHQHADDAGHGEPGHEHSDDEPLSLEEAHARLAAIDAQLQRAHATRKYGGQAISIVGVIVLLGGCLLMRRS